VLPSFPLLLIEEEITYSWNNHRDGDNEAAEFRIGAIISSE
jgi:hypothetical protein